MSFDEIAAAPDWHCVDFISDVHLQENEPANFLAWRKYLQQSPADAIFILGDLFEVWVGDDGISAQGESQWMARHEGLHFEDRCCRVLHDAAQQRPLYFLHGNRDFLVGSDFAKACGIQLLSDPSVLSFAGQRYLLSHGDALCLADVEYQTFRSMVRSPAWQEKFLATPLQERIQQARMMRQASEQRKQAQQGAGQAWVDVDAAAMRQWMDATDTTHVIHGHTHEGRDHPIASAQGQGVRHVLPDWHVADQPPKGYVLRLTQSQSPSLARVAAQHVALA
jgi:UDP-2,3-diacylglucosamine hydrolase